MQIHHGYNTECIYTCTLTCPLIICHRGYTILNNLQRVSIDDVTFPIAILTCLHISCHHGYYYEQCRMYVSINCTLTCVLIIVTMDTIWAMQLVRCYISQRTMITCPCYRPCILLLKMQNVSINELHLTICTYNCHHGYYYGHSRE